MRRKICNYAGCNNLIESTETYCIKHKVDKKPEPFKNARRSNEGLYNTLQWRKLKKEILKCVPYCSKCGISKEETVLEIHHIIPPRGNEDLFFDESNLIPVCGKCHRILTNIEIRGRIKRK